MTQPAAQPSDHHPFDTLFALALRSGRIVEIDLATGRSRDFLQQAGRAPDGIAVVHDRVYWTTMGAPTIVDRAAFDAGLREQALTYAERNGGVHVVGIDGTGRGDVVRPGGITTGKQLVHADGWLYWGDREGMRVSRVRTDGTGLEDLVVNDGSGGVADWCVGVAVDGDDLYWTQKGPSKGGDGRILRTRISGGSGREVLWQGLPEPIDLEVHDGHLYWTDRGAGPRGNTLNRAPLPADGQPGAPPEILADGFAEAIGLAVDGAAGVVYVADLSGTVRSVPLPGSSASPAVLAELGEPVTGIAGRTKETTR